MCCAARLRKNFRKLLTKCLKYDILIFHRIRYKLAEGKRLY